MDFSFVLIGLVASVLVGGVVVSYFNATNNSQMIKLALAFSGGFLLASAVSSIFCPMLTACPPWRILVNRYWVNHCDLFLPY